MKNHIIFKFIAVILCAASLLGTVGSALGIVLLTSEGLYDVTVEEMVAIQVSQDSAQLADWLVKNYTSTELGGASEELVRSHFGNHWFTNKYDPAHYGYAILDAQGNELQSFNPELRDRNDLYAKESFPVTGKYIHVLSLESEQDRQERHREQRETMLGEDIALAESGGTVPAEGAVVESLLFADAQGRPILEAWDNGAQVTVVCHEEDFSRNWSIGEASLGFLFYSPQGNVLFHSGFDYRAYVGTMADANVYEAYFTFRDGQVRLYGEEPVGRLYLNDNGHLMFLSAAVEPVAAEETLAAAVETTVPETTAETLPPETTEATEAATEETVASSASDEPEETAAPKKKAAKKQAPAQTLPPETTPAETVPAETVPAETVPETTEPVLINGKPLEEYEILSEHYYDPQKEDTIHARYVYVPLPELTVEVYMTGDALRNANGYRALELLRTYRNYLLPAMGICLLVLAVFTVYLCTAAGRKPKSDEVRAGGLNRLPLDLYLLGGGFGVACILVLGSELMAQIWEQDFWTGCGVLVGIGALSSLLLVGFFFAFVAQIKTPDGFWWRNTLCGHFIRLSMKFMMWLEQWLSRRGLPFCGRVIRNLWQMTMRGMVWLYKVTEKMMLWLGDKAGRFGRWLWNLLHRFLKRLPITWQWLMAGLVIIFCMMLVPGANDFMTVVLLLIPIGIVLYGAHCYGTLAESAHRMGKGDLDTKVDDKLLVGCFKESAADLNALAEVAVVAAQKQLKSERMKTELITNVSHDIKTPLTSIINYVDLLQRPHTEEEGAQYLEVLDRQSQRLKKLIEDLMDMSKANTGNMQVEITTVDAVESVNQALGEFSEKLDRAHLIPVFRHGADRMAMRADGRLVWRVLSNLLGNAVKYAMPGTRLYIDVMELEDQVMISLKNISREELNVDAAELMERFVRGDDSRNTEGSGLGLNIAKSLMELQKGQLQLLVDGDLFKVTLTFPGVKE